MVHGEGAAAMPGAGLRLAARSEGAKTDCMEGVRMQRMGTDGVRCVWRPASVAGMLFSLASARAQPPAEALGRTSSCRCARGGWSHLVLRLLLVIRAFSQQVECRRARLQEGCHAEVGECVELARAEEVARSTPICRTYFVQLRAMRTLAYLTYAWQAAGPGQPIQE
jgi:hypothetical protein